MRKAAVGGLTDEGLREALRDCLVSPNVADLNWEPANIVDVLADMNRSLGGIADGLNNIASAIRGK
jgi:hypothetical protein